MTDLYRHCTHDEQPVEAEADLCNLCLPWLGFVPDTRLQAIADAWAEYTDAVKDERMAQQEWLEIMRLLDGLTEEDSDV